MKVVVPGSPVQLPARHRDAWVWFQAVFCMGFMVESLALGWVVVWFLHPSCVIIVWPMLLSHILFMCHQHCVVLAV